MIRNETQQPHRRGKIAIIGNRRKFLLSVGAVAILANTSVWGMGSDVAVQCIYFTPAEAVKLAALADRIIPRDEWPSASEAGVVSYIDFQLASDWGHGQGLFQQGPHLRGTDQQGYQLSHTPRELYRLALGHAALRGFESLTVAEQDRIIGECAANRLSLGDIPGIVFFTALRQNVVEGYFSDPIHGGNLDFSGWRMVGFPGAHAYYLTDVDRFNMSYDRAPSGVASRAGKPAAGPIIMRGQR